MFPHFLCFFSLLVYRGPYAVYNMQSPTTATNPYLQTVELKTEPSETANLTDGQSLKWPPSSLRYVDFEGTQTKTNGILNLLRHFIQFLPVIQVSTMKIPRIKLYGILKNKTDLCYTLLNMSVTQQTKVNRVTKVIQCNRHATIILGAYESCQRHFVRSVLSAISRQELQTVFNNKALHEVSSAPNSSRRSFTTRTLTCCRFIYYTKKCRVRIQPKPSDF